jgi:hypothetical protein
MMDADKTQLEELVADQLSYGHSGVIETKAQFVDVIVSKKTVYKAITISEPSDRRDESAWPAPVSQSYFRGAPL